MSEKVPHYEIVTAQEIYNYDYPEIEYLIDELIPSVGLILICGASKIGKSWFVLQLLVALSSSTSFLNREVKEAYSCLYLALEDTHNRIKNRFVKMNIVPNEKLLIATKWRCNGQGIVDLQNVIKENEYIKVIVIDTYGKFAHGRNDSRFQSDYDWMGMLKEFADKNNLAVILIHHTRKMKDELDSYNEISGTTANMAVADSILLLKRMRESREGTLSCTSRDYEDTKFLRLLKKSRFI